MRLINLVITFTFSLIFLNSVTSASELPHSKYPLYEGVSLENINFNNKSKLGRSYTKLSVNSGSFIENSIWENQQQLRDEIYDAMGGYRISSELIDEDIFHGSQNYNFSLKASLRPQRIVRIVNNYDEENPRVFTQYMVSDSLNLVNTLNIGNDLTNITRLNLMRVQSSIGIQKISYVNSLEDYNSARPPTLLSKYIDDSESFDDYVKSQEKGQSRIFFKGFFDPYRVGKRFIKITSEKIKEDSSFRVGDVLIKAMTRRYGPGVHLSKGLADLGYDINSYQEVKIGIKKENNDSYLLKLQLEEGYSHDINFTIGVPLISYKPHRSNYDRTTYVIAENLYRLDLGNSVATKQLDDLLNNVGKPLTPTAYYENLLRKIQVIPGVVDELFEKTRSTLVPKTRSRHKMELGFFGFRGLESKSVESSVTRPTNHHKSEHVLGEVQKYKSTRLRVAVLDSNEDNKRRFRILTRKMQSGALETDLGFEYAFDDSRTSSREYARYLEFISRALFLEDHIYGTQAQKLRDIIDSRLQNKSRIKDQQSASASVYFSQDFVRQIVSKTRSDIERLLAQMILGPGKDWKDLVRLAKNKGPSDCSSQLNPKYVDILFGKNKRACYKVLSMAVKILNTFKTAKTKKGNYHTIAQRFAELVSSQEMRPFIPMLMLKAGLLQSFDSNGNPSYGSLQEAIENNNIEMNLILIGDGIQGAIMEQVGDVAALTPYEYEGDFKLETPRSSMPLIFKGEVATDGSKLYLRFDSLTKAQPSYVLKGIASHYRLIRSDVPKALIKVENLISKDMVDKNQRTSFYRYTVELPLIPELQQHSGSTIQFWIEDGAGVRITEPFNVKFET